MSSDSTQTQAQPPAGNSAKGFWFKVILLVIILIAGFLYIRSLALKSKVSSTAEGSVPLTAIQQQAGKSEQPQPAPAIREQDDNAGEATPMAEVTPVIVAESVQQPATETEERSAQIEQQAQTPVLAPATGTGEAAPETPEQPGVEPVEIPAAVIEVEEQTTVTEEPADVPAPVMAGPSPATETGEAAPEAQEQTAAEPAETPAAVIEVEEQATATEETAEVPTPEMTGPSPAIQETG